MKILAIESSCDETAASVIEVTDGDIKILSNIIASQIDIHKKFGGVFPEIASRAHAEKIIEVVSGGLGALDIKKDVDFIAVTAGPGLIGSLLVGVNTAKALAYANDKPIIGINHWLGHVYSCFARTISNFQFPISNQIQNLPQFPLLALIVSGGHTGLVIMKSHTDIQTIGQTLDDAAGEAFDKVAKILGLGYPGGPAIAATAAQVKSHSIDESIRGNSLRNYKSKVESHLTIKFPRSMLDRDNFDFSFSGLKTSVLYKVQELTKKYPLEKIRNQVAYEFQQCVIDILIGKTLKAAEKYQPKSILLCGGVSANKELREQMAETIKIYCSSLSRTNTSRLAAAHSKNISFFLPPMPLTGDNAAMIGIAAAYQIANGIKPTTFDRIDADSNLKL